MQLLMNARKRARHRRYRHKRHFRPRGVGNEFLLSRGLLLLWLSPVSGAVLEDVPLVCLEHAHPVLEVLLLLQHLQRTSAELDDYLGLVDDPSLLIALEGGLALPLNECVCVESLLKRDLRGMAAV